MRTKNEPLQEKFFRNASVESPYNSNLRTTQNLLTMHQIYRLSIPFCHLRIPHQHIDIGTINAGGTQTIVSCSQTPVTKISRLVSNSQPCKNGFQNPLDLKSVGLLKEISMQSQKTTFTQQPNAHMNSNQSEQADHSKPKTKNTQNTYPHPAAAECPPMANFGQILCIHLPHHIGWILTTWDIMAGESLVKIMLRTFLIVDQHPTSPFCNHRIQIFVTQWLPTTSIWHDLCWLGACDS